MNKSKIKRVVNPPKGSYSSEFLEKWNEYYKEAVKKAKIKFPNLSTKEMNKIFSLKRKGYSVNEIILFFDKILKKKISKSEINKLFDERKKASITAWVRIKHKYEKSKKSGRWILKKK